MKGLNAMLFYAEGTYSNENLSHMMIKQLIFTRKDDTSKRLCLEGVGCDCMAKYGSFICRWRDVRLNGEKIKDLNRIATLTRENDISLTAVVADCNAKTELHFDEISLFNNYDKYSLNETIMSDDIPI